MIHCNQIRSGVRTLLAYVTNGEVTHGEMCHRIALEVAMAA